MDSLLNRPMSATTHLGRNNARNNCTTVSKVFKLDELKKGKLGMLWDSSINTGCPVLYILHTLYMIIIIMCNVYNI